MSPEVIRIHALIQFFSAIGCWAMSALLEKQLRELLDSESQASCLMDRGGPLSPITRVSNE